MDSLKTLFERVLSLVYLVIFAVSLVVVFDVLGGLVQVDSVSPVSGTAVYKQKEVNYGIPVRLKIPKINVDAVIGSVGLTPKGLMGVPKGPSGVAWFELGPRPGEGGSAVISGHYGRWKSGEGSVFDELNNLSKGDIVTIEDGNGEVSTFIVREMRTYGPNDDALNVFSSEDGKAHLNLITCEGVWDGVYKTYSERLVVFTDKK